MKINIRYKMFLMMTILLGCKTSADMAANDGGGGGSSLSTVGVGIPSEAVKTQGWEIEYPLTIKVRSKNAGMICESYSSGSDCKTISGNELTRTLAEGTSKFSARLTNGQDYHIDVQFNIRNSSRRRYLGTRFCDDMDSNYGLPFRMNGDANVSVKVCDQNQIDVFTTIDSNEKQSSLNVEIRLPQHPGDDGSSLSTEIVYDRLALINDIKNKRSLPTAAGDTASYYALRIENHSRRNLKNCKMSGEFGGRNIQWMTLFDLPSGEHWIEKVHMSDYERGKVLSGEQLDNIRLNCTGVSDLPVSPRN